MAHFSLHSSTPLLDQAAACMTQMRGKQEQWCALVLAEEGLNFWADPLKAVGLLLCPQALNSTEATTFLSGGVAGDLLAKISSAAGGGEARRLPAGDSAEFGSQLERALKLLRGKVPAYESYSDALRTHLQTHAMEATVPTASPASAAAATATVTPERRMQFLLLVDKAVMRTNAGQGACCALRASDMPSNELLHQLYFTLGTTRPSLPPQNKLKIGREEAGAVLIPRNKSGEPEGGVPPRHLQLAEFDVLCWALALAGSIFTQKGEVPGAFTFDKVDYVCKVRPDTSEAAAGEKYVLSAGKLSLFMEVSRDMRRACEGESRDGASATQTQALIAEFYTRLSRALAAGPKKPTLNQAVLSLYEAGGVQRLFAIAPEPHPGKRARQETAGGGGGGGNTSSRGRGGGGRGGGRGGGGKPHSSKKEDKKGTGAEATAAFFDACKQHGLCSNFQLGKCKRDDCRYTHKLLKDL
jgi:hypothetical protein